MEIGEMSGDGGENIPSSPSIPSSSHHRNSANTMEIAIESLLEGARRAAGTVAVIDVFRAFTTAAVALANGARRIIMVRSVEEVLALRNSGVGQVCMGEVGGRAPDGFDFGNSPFEILPVDFGGKTIIQRTSAGTQASSKPLDDRTAFMPPLSSPPMRRCRRSVPVRLIASRWSPWATAGAPARMRMRSAPFTCAIGFKPARA